MPPTPSQILQRFGPSPDGYLIWVDVPTQRMTLYRGDEAVLQWPVSTSKHGTGSRENSFQTPTGAHRVADKIGAGAALGAVFKGRRPTGEVAEIHTRVPFSEQDFITTRILWLEGLEDGVNRGPGVDSHDRYIYIHGTAEEGCMGTPASIGCVRMRNADVVALFERVAVGTLVYITP